MREAGVFGAEGWRGERAAPVAAAVERRFAAALGFEVRGVVHCGESGGKMDGLFHGGKMEVWRNLLEIFVGIATMVKNLRI